MQTDILQIKGLTKRFEGFSLEDVTFSLPRGFIMGLIGPNGAGKTTTIKLILNMLRRDGGSIAVFGRDNLTAEQEIKEKLGIVMDKIFYVEEWRLTDVDSVMSRFYANWDKAGFYRLLDRFGLSKGKKVGELSRGMKLKLMIASALAHDAELLILDEPTSGLDALARSELLDILSDFISDGNRSVLFSTHISADLEKTADYITFLCGGRVLFTGQKDELHAKYALVKGGLNALSPDQKNRLIGYREHSVGFDALAERSALNGLPSSVIAEPAQLDEIIVRFGGENRHE